MRIIPLVLFLAILGLGMYFIPQFVGAQSSNEERCDEEICHIQITKNGFMPQRLIVKTETTIIWTNFDDGRHTVTSGSPGAITAPLKSFLLNKGDTYEYTFDGLHTGSYKYFDQVTGIMRGEIIVEAAPEQIKETAELQTINIDFTDPNSGIRKVSFPTGNISSIAVVPDLNKLIITIESTITIGNLEITLDRNLIDARLNGKDLDFTVLVNGKEGFYENISSSSEERKIGIAVPVKSKLIEIVGTQASAKILGFSEASSAISEVEKSVTEFKNRGIIITKAESKLAEAKQIFDTGKYTLAESLANDAKMLANNTNRTASLAGKALDEAEASITNGNDRSFDVSNAEQLLAKAKQEYVNGNYDEALNFAVNAKNVVSNVNISTTNSTDRNDVTLLAAVVGASAAGAVGAFVYARSRRRIISESKAAGGGAEPYMKERRIIDLNKIFAEKPYLRDDDKEAIKFIVEKGGEAFETEIRDRFNLTKSTAWRLVKRLDREEIVEVKKAGLNNLIRIRQEFTRTDGNSATT